jgi:hypothetical protein
MFVRDVYGKMVQEQRVGMKDRRLEEVGEDGEDPDSILGDETGIW